MLNIREKIYFLKKLSVLFNRREKTQFLIILLLALMVAIFQTLGILSVIPFISLVMNPGIVQQNPHLSWVYDFFEFSSTTNFMIAFGVVMLLIIVLGNLLTAAAIYMRTYFVYRKTHRVSTSLLSKYLSLPHAYFLAHNTSDLNKNVLSESQILMDSVLMPVLEIVVDIIAVSFIVVTLLLVSPAATSIILTVVAGFYVIIFRSGYRTKLKTKGYFRMKENQFRYKASSEALSGIKEIKLANREDYYVNSFSNHSRSFYDLKAWNIVASQMPRYFLETVAFGGVILFIILLLISARNTSNVIPLASFFVFAGYRMMPIINRMVASLTNLQFNRIVLDKIHHDIIEEGEASEYEISQTSSEIIEFNKEIAINELSFAYTGKPPYVFKDVNLKILKDSSVALIGPTGTGKTTLVDIVLGLLKPTSGSITVDGVKISDKNVRSWQGKLGYVPQHIYLFDDSITRNIAFGIEDDCIDMEKVRRAAKLANIHTFITEELPEQYETVIGERGVRLSGGQRQRLGIARALYNDPEILILDEATSSLDGITEDAVLKAIENVSKQKTLIVIAHRITTLKNCDLIHIMDKGRIVDSGTFKELRKYSALFRELENRYEDNS